MRGRRSTAPRVHAVGIRHLRDGIRLPWLSFLMNVRFEAKRRRLKPAPPHPGPDSSRARPTDAGVLPRRGSTGSVMGCVTVCKRPSCRRDASTQLVATCLRRNAVADGRRCDRRGDVHGPPRAARRPEGAAVGLDPAECRQCGAQYEQRTGEMLPVCEGFEIPAVKRGENRRSSTPA